MLSNSKKRVNRMLAFYIVAVFLWLTTNLATNLASSSDLSLILARTTLVGAALIPFAFVLFVRAYLSMGLSAKTILKWGALPLVILLTTPTPLNIISIEAYGENTKAGFIYTVMVIEFMLYFMWGCHWLLKARRSKRYTQTQKTQILYILAGVVAAVIPGLIVNGLLPALGYSDAVFFGPVASVFFAVFTTIAIIRHSFLDVRLIVARTLGYIFTLVTLVGVYVLAIFGVASRYLGTGDLTGLQQLLYIVATLTFGFSLAPLKRFFDKITNRLFYRDAYDAQDLFDKLNKMLVGNVNLESLLKQSAELISTTLKAEFGGFIIRKTDNADPRIVLSRKHGLNHERILSFNTKGKTTNTSAAIVADELDERQSDLRTVLSEDGIALLSRLAVVDKTTIEIGYMVMGQKQSGNPYNRQDIQVLEIVANELVIAIQNALRFEEIEAFNVTLQQKVDDATRQLRITNEKLKALDETKDEFISMASHQLRTPLTAVKGYVSMVVEGDAGKLNKQQQELLNQAFSSSQRMVYLIADLLNVSRLKSGKFVIENKPTQLADVVASEMEQLTEVAKSKGQTLVFNRPDSFPELMLDETKIRQVIMNFADNALHYTASGGHIQISLEDKGDSVEYTVTDDGMGVPKHEQHHLFTKFFRAGNAKNARPDGTGLGLFMAKKVIIAQGGAVIFRSEEGKGSTFGFTFPKARVTSSTKQKL